MKNIALILCICITLSFAGCASQPTNGIPDVNDPGQNQGQGPGNGRGGYGNMERAVMGKVVSVTEGNITIDLAENQMNQQRQGNGQPPQRGDGQPPQQPQGGNGQQRQRPEGAPDEQQRQMPEMKLTGEQKEYAVTANTVVSSGGFGRQQQQQQEQPALSMSDVAVGSNVVLQLDEAQTTVVSIRLMRSAN